MDDFFDEHDVINIANAGRMLDEIAEEIPAELLAELNGGILLFPETKRHSDPEAEGLYILGEYHREYILGRRIIIYFGSFRRAYRNLSEGEMKRRLREILLHELTHHIESLAGERGLEIEDEIALNRYKNAAKRTKN